MRSSALSLLKPLFIANWKMNMSPSRIKVFLHEFLKTPSVQSHDAEKFGIDIGIAPCALSFIDVKKRTAKLPIMTGVQNVHWEKTGPFTGEVSAKVAEALGARFSIVGHSERKSLFGDTDITSAQRSKASALADLITICCLGENETECKDGRSHEVIKEQLEIYLRIYPSQKIDNLVIAYEPVWAIGTGEAADLDTIQEIHLMIREGLCKKFSNTLGIKIPILYGGSTKPENIDKLMSCPNVDGALIGGASLDPESFSEMIIKGRHIFRCRADASFLQDPLFVTMGERK